MKYTGATKLYHTADGRVVGHDDPDRVTLIAVPNLDVAPAYEKDVKAYLSNQRSDEAEPAETPEAEPPAAPRTKQRTPAENK